MSSNDGPAKIIDSNSGWRYFAKTLSESSPRGLAQSEKARHAIRSLIRTGR